MARKVNKIDNSFGKYSLDVTARPVDTYVTPERPREADDAGGEYMQLARALATVHAPLTAFLKTKQDEQVEADIAKGRQHYMDDAHGALSWEDWTKLNPEIPVNQSVKRGYLMARAANDAKRLEAQMTDAYNRGEAVVTIGGKPVNVAETDDAVAFNEWERGFVRQFIEQNMGDDTPPDIFEHIFQTELNQVTAGIYNMHEAKRNNSYLVKSEAEIGTLFDNTVYDCIDEEGVYNPGDDTARAARSRQVGGLIDSLMTQGFSRERAIEIIVSKAAALAENDNICNAGEILDMVMDATLADGTRIGAIGGVEAPLRRQMKHVQAEQERKEAKRKEEIANNAMDSVYYDFLSTRRYNPSTVKILQNAGVSWRDAHAMDTAMKTASDRVYGSGSGTANAAKKEGAAAERVHFRLRFPNGYKRMDVVEAYNDGEISSFVDVEKLLNECDEADTPLNRVIKDNSADIDSKIKAWVPDDPDGPTEDTLIARDALRTKVKRAFREQLNQNPDFVNDIDAQEDIITDTIIKNAKEFTVQAPDIRQQVGQTASISDAPEQVTASRKARSVTGVTPEQHAVGKRLYAKYQEAVRTRNYPLMQKIRTELEKNGIDPEYWETVLNAYDQTGGEPLSE